MRPHCKTRVDLSKPGRGRRRQTGMPTARLFVSIVALVVTVVIATAPHAATPSQTEAPIFQFENRAWVNLHHFLYVLGRAAAGLPDAKREAVAQAPADASSASLSEIERDRWNNAVSRYAVSFSKQDLVFDAPAIAATNAIAAVSDGSALSATAVPVEIRNALTDVMPIYQKRWWPAHADANRKRIAEFYGQLSRHGRPMVDRLTRLYGERWPAGGVRVQVAAYTNWSGAYSTRGPLLVVASLPSAHDGTSGLEILFHEAMHQWDDQMEARLRRASAIAGTAPPGDLSHALIFYTAGHVTRVVAGDAHVPYAEANGIWQRSLGRFKPVLDAHWKPYLDGTGSIDDALIKILRAMPKD